MKSCTFTASVPDCGISEPGIAPSDSMNSRSSATRIEVSCRQNQRAQPVISRPVHASHPAAPGFRTPPKEPGTTVSTGAVESWDPAAPSSPSALTPTWRLAAGAGSVAPPVPSAAVFPVSVVLMDQIPTVKPWVQPCMS